MGRNGFIKGMLISKWHGRGERRQKRFHEGSPYEEILEGGKWWLLWHKKRIQNRFWKVKCLPFHSEAINRPHCGDFPSEVPVPVVTSPCVFWLPRHIPVCLDGRAPTHKPDLFIMGKFLRFPVSDKLCLPITSCKHLCYGDFLQKNLLESIWPKKCSSGNAELLRNLAIKWALRMRMQ